MVKLEAFHPKTHYIRYIGKGIREYIEFCLSPLVLNTFANQGNILSKRKKITLKKWEKIEHKGMKTNISGTSKSKENWCINVNILRPF